MFMHAGYTTRVSKLVPQLKTQKMVLDASLLNTQDYKVRIKGKVEPSREWSTCPPLHLGVVAIEKGAFGLPSTKVANFTYMVSSMYYHLIMMIIICLHTGI